MPADGGAATAGAAAGGGSGSGAGADGGGVSVADIVPALRENAGARRSDRGGGGNRDIYSIHGEGAARRRAISELIFFAGACGGGPASAAPVLPRCAAPRGAAPHARPLEGRGEGWRADR